MLKRASPRCRCSPGRLKQLDRQDSLVIRGCFREQRGAARRNPTYSRFFTHRSRAATAPDAQTARAETSKRRKFPVMTTFKHAAAAAFALGALLIGGATVRGQAQPGPKAALQEGRSEPSQRSKLAAQVPGIVKEILV